MLSHKQTRSSFERICFMTIYARSSPVFQCKKWNLQTKYIGTGNGVCCHIGIIDTTRTIPAKRYIQFSEKEKSEKFQFIWHFRAFSKQNMQFLPIQVLFHYPIFVQCSLDSQYIHMLLHWAKVCLYVWKNSSCCSKNVGLKNCQNEHMKSEKPEFCCFFWMAGNQYYRKICK